MKAILVVLFLLPIAHAQMQKQQQCAALVRKDIEKTRMDSPAVFATLNHYMFEWSNRHQSCVMVVQYRVKEKGKPPDIQISAVNAVTMQSMEGYKNIFLVPESDQKQIMDATNFLFERYSH